MSTAFHLTGHGPLFIRREDIFTMPANAYLDHQTDF